MIENEIKSIFRNKSNIIYIVMFIIISIIINIVVNINNIIDKYYDNQMNIFIDKLNLSESEKELTIENFKIVGLGNVDPIDDDTVEKIKKINHVQEVQKLERKNGVIWEVNRVIVDDWKNCKYVQRKLDKMGLDNYIVSDDNLLNSYSVISQYSNIIVYFSIILSFIILIISCNNIIKNEKNNNKILNILGYTYGKIRKIAFLQLMAIMGIGFIFGASIANIIMFCFTNNVLKVNNYYNVILTIIINISIIILTIIISLRNIKMRKK